MDYANKSVILGNIDFLVSSTKYDKLMDACLQYPSTSSGQFFFTHKMKLDIENQHEKEKDRHLALFKKITQRGPRAFGILMEILKENNFNSALEKLSFKSISKKNLNNTASTNNILQNRRPSNLQTNIRTDMNGNDKLQLVPVELSPDDLSVLKLSEVSQPKLNTAIDSYPMTKRKKGVLLIVNIKTFESDVKKERKGADFDTLNLRILFEKLDFIIFKYEDITKSQFQEILSELIDSDYCKKTQCFALALMSHGETDNKDYYVTFHDNQMETIHNIMDNFSNRNSPSLSKKPKILFFPFCRGGNKDDGVRNERNDENETQQDAHLTSTTPYLPSFSDMLICYGSLPGYVANREPSEGSWYINALYKVFESHAHDTHIEDLLKMIGPKIEELYGHKLTKQTPVFWNYAFNKHLYFNPGIYNN